jgi:hypothetical protein
MLSESETSLASVVGRRGGNDLRFFASLRMTTAVYHFIRF